MKDTALIWPATEGEANQARRALQALRDGKPIAGDAAPPAGVTAALERVLETMATGGGVAVVSLNSERTTHEAADLLGLSTPMLIKLLDDGALAFRTLDGRRRVKTTDVLALRERRRDAQSAALDDVVAENQRAGLYDE